MSSAPAPSRKSGGFTWNIGLLVIPLDKFSSSQDSATHRSQYTRVVKDVNGTKVEELHPVGMTSYDKVTGVNVTKDQIIKCVESLDGTLVEVTDDELQAFRSGDAGDTQFLGFIKRDEFEANYVTEKAYQARPAKAKLPNGTSSSKPSPYNKVYALLLESMRQEESIALFKVTERGNEKPYALLPDGSLFSLLYDEEVREALPLPIAELSAAESKQGVGLVKKFLLNTPPVLTDETSAAVSEFVEAKAAAMAKGETVVLPEAVEAVAPKQEDDLMALLGASLDE